MNAKDRTIMDQSCSLIIGMDWRIKFVGIVDQNGKLLIGKSRSNPSNKIADKIIDTTNSVTNSRVDDLFEVYFKYKNMYLFYSDYLLWVIEKCRVSIDEQEHKYNFSYITHSFTKNSMPSYFEVSGCNKDNVKLAVTPLNICMHRFFCIYFEPAYSIRNSTNGTREGFEHLLSKIITNIL